MNNLIAITGGIGSGKSLLARNISKLGYETYDMDKLVKRVYDMPVGKAFVQDEIPKALTRNGIDFDLLRSVLFDEKHRDYDSNRIVRFEKFFAKRATDLLKREVSIFTKPNELSLFGDSPVPVYVECPMLFELSQRGFIDKSIFDYVVNVSCPDSIRLDRACFRDRSDPEIITAMMNRQWSEEERRAEADINIKNEGDTDDMWVNTFRVIRVHDLMVLRKYAVECYE